ncbi:extracellular solute-binding protein [Kineococcus indalonis]|uniref:extracellular solute-binding protein n=1 Tax=Kineococcus indalonis TaxID=2696566 RepID=UPI0014135075|nr:extracellular solute-binding protein [Kineococcus indalonis]NAZ86636.1 extracellular solute-binding protein [Kineococcus indalonis]
MTRTTLSRRTALRAAGAAALGVGAAGLTSCADPVTGSGSGGQLAYWNFFTGGDGERMVQLVDSYRDEAPQVQVTDTTLAWGAPYYTKLAMACAGGRAPDLATMHMSRLPPFAAHLLDPFDLDELAARGITADQFPERVWDKAQHDGQLYALPLDTHPMVLYVNTDLCDRAGLMGTDGQLAPITSAEQFLDAGRRLADVTGSTGISWAAADGLGGWMMFWSVFRQLGGRLELPQGGTAQVDRDAMVQAFSFIRDLTDGTICSPTLDGPAAPAVFASQQAGLFVLGPWELITAETAGIPFTMQQFPALFGDQPLIRADSHSFVLPRQASLDPARRSAAYDMAASMLRNSLSWAGGGHIPALSAVSDSPEFLALQPQANYAGAADVVEYDPDAYFSGSGSQLMSFGGQQILSVSTRAQTPEQATDTFLTWVDQQLAIPSPV